MIAQVAPRLPDCEYLIVGARHGSLPDRPANVVEVPFIPNEELPAHYGEASFYLQLSVSEGFGNALCEAMLCGCIPVVSEVGAMPEIVGDAGVVVPKRDVDVLEGHLQRALALDRERHARMARERIVRERPEVLRGEGLRQRLESVLV
jgi:glycosyltransferase involved in cell wall biosynthesis